MPACRCTYRPAPSPSTPAAMLALVRTLAARHHGTTAAIDALADAATAAGGTWTPTVVGIGLAPGGGLGKLNVYLAAGAS